MPADRPGPAVLRFVLLDSVDPACARELVARVSRAVAVPCRLRPEPLEAEPRWIEGRPQVDARSLLEALEAGADDGSSVRVGLTERDLALPVFTHVFGLARHHGHAAVVSLARLRPEFYGLPADPAATARRAAREILHEVGHVFGLEHCPDFECIMHFAPDVDRIDLRGDRYCRLCRGRLPGGFVGA